MELQEMIRIVRDAGYSPILSSYTQIQETVFMLAERDGQKKLIVHGQPSVCFSGAEVMFDARPGKICPQTHNNAESLKKFCPWLRPVSPTGRKASFGTGDRLGLVTGAHIAALAPTDVFPILAQQSRRELLRTERTNQSMMETVMWQVFESGYRGGYGADGDHLKTLDEVQSAIRDGCTFITIDCSDHIPGKHEVDRVTHAKLVTEYCGKSLPVVEDPLQITQQKLEDLLLLYQEAINHICMIFEKAISTCGREISLEISLDETAAMTGTEGHFFVANELRKRGVPIYSLAPKFCGEFQKGIDYIGDTAEFQKNLRNHVKVAEYFGHKVSIHSGSDKFQILPFVGSECHGRYHLKTSGTSWVEAVRVIAARDQVLFCEMLQYACRNFEKAAHYYHVSAKVDNVPDLHHIHERNYPKLLDQPDIRQILHITYGELLTARDAEGELLFKPRIYHVLEENRDILNTVITNHIRRHIEKIEEGERSL